jgi:hypothetical protein
LANALADYLTRLDAGLDNLKRRYDRLAAVPCQALRNQGLAKDKFWDDMRDTIANTAQIAGDILAFQQAIDDVMGRCGLKRGRGGPVPP